MKGDLAIAASSAASLLRILKTLDLTLGPRIVVAVNICLQDLHAALGMDADGQIKETPAYVRRDALAELTAAALAKVPAIANDAAIAWDADQDMRAGKILIALSGRRGYRADVDLIHDMIQMNANPEVAPTPILNALVNAHNYLDSALRPCDADCPCVLHLLEEALGLPTSRGAGRS